MLQSNPRRQFIRQILRKGIFVLSAAFVACNRPSQSADTLTDDIRPASCDDLSGLSEQDLKLRETFGYLRESTVADNRCSNCNLWIPNKADPSCGKCLLFKGPVQAAGHCTSWAPQTSGS